MRLDHLAIAAETLEEGVTWAQDRLGVPFSPGGKHARFGTHNQLLGLEGGLYLEVIAIDPDVICEGPRWFALDGFKGPPRLANWICETGNLDAALAHGMRKVAMERGGLRWDMGVPSDGSLPMDGGFPTVLQWHTDTPPGQSLPRSGCALLRLTVKHPLAQAISEQLAGQLTDIRVHFETSDHIELNAEFETPDGMVTL